MKHHVSAIIDDDFWQVVKEEKLQEGDFEVESSMSFGSSHWCRSTLREENRPMKLDEYQPTHPVKHRSTPSMEADEEHRESFANSTATHTKRKIRVVQPIEQGVYRDKDGNAQTMDGRIIDVSKEDIEAILEMADKSGGKYLSLLQYEGCFQMPGVRPPVHYPPARSYSKDNIEELLNDISTSKNIMFDEI
uniref:Uncharacterized protein n=1 Tax=Brassica campestris TaxID=3711 RepID=M4FBX7_BRACM